MTNSSKTPNFIDSRSAGLARVRLRVPKNNSQPIPQRPNQGKIKPPLSTLSRLSQPIGENGDFSKVEARKGA
jgi:hypothetical protein